MYHITSGICLKYMNTSLNSGIQRNPQVYCQSKEVNGRKNPMLGICTRTLVFTLLRLVNILDWYVSNTGYFVNCSQSIFFLPRRPYNDGCSGYEDRKLLFLQCIKLEGYERMCDRQGREIGVFFILTSPLNEDGL